MVWFKEEIFQTAVVREEKQPFTVDVQSTDRVDVFGKRTEIAECHPPLSIRELTKHSERLVEQNVVKRSFVSQVRHAGWKEVSTLLQI